MATDNEINQIERRAELAVKVATLEERSLQNQTHLTRIETMLIHHATDEEAMLKNINTSLKDIKDEVDAKISDAIGPIKTDIVKAKTLIAAGGTIVTMIISAISMFKEQILSFLRGN